MSYKVVKKVKGHYYLYIQKSWRENGVVKTESHYLGKVDEAYASQIKKAKQKRRAKNKEISQNIKNIRSEVKEIITPQSDIKNIDAFEENRFLSKTASFSIHRKSSAKIKPIITHQFSFLTDSIDKKKRVKIEYPYLKIKSEAKFSHAELWKKYRRNINQLSKKYDIEKMPQITIKTGNDIKIKRRNALNYTLIIPNKVGVRNLIPEEYDKIFARIELDLMKSQNPEKYNDLKTEFQNSLQNTKRHLKTFVKNYDNYSDKESYNIALSLFDSANTIKKTKKGDSIIPKEKLGIGYYGKLSFENEFAYLRKKNSATLKKQIKSKIRGCKKSLANQEKKKVSLLKKSEKKREIKALKSRIKLHNEMLKRVEIFSTI